MQNKRTLLFVLGGHLLLLVLIYAPFAFKPMEALEILVPASST